MRTASYARPTASCRRGRSCSIQRASHFGQPSSRHWSSGNARQQPHRVAVALIHGGEVERKLAAFHGFQKHLQLRPEERADHPHALTWTAFDPDHLPPPPRIPKRMERRSRIVPPPLERPTLGIAVGNDRAGCDPLRKIPMAHEPNHAPRGLAQTCVRFEIAAIRPPQSFEAFRRGG